MNDLLRVLRIEGKSEAIQPLLAERLAGLRRAAERPGAGPLALHAYAWELLNNESADLRDAEAALPFARRAVELDGGRDADLLDTLAQAYSAVGDLDRAIETQRQAIVRARIRGPYDRADLESRLIDYLLRKGDLLGVASASWGELAGRIGESLFPGSVPGESLVSRSETLIDEGRYDEAASVLRGCLSMRQKALPEGHWLIADTISRLGGAVAGTGDREGAESLLLEGQAGLERDHRTPANRRRQGMQRLVRLYENWDKPDKASEWRRRLAAAEVSAEDTPEKHPDR
jgi:tetratricopeptide (TPR) repeat protein